MTFAERLAQRRHRGAEEGFTLLELLIAIAILAIIAMVAIPNILSYLEGAKKSTAKQTVKALENGITLYYAHVGKYPDRLQDLMRAPTDEKIKKKWQGPYLKGDEIPEDPWGNPYQYKITQGAKHPYDLYSFGPNGRGAPQPEGISVWD